MKFLIRCTCIVSECVVDAWRNGARGVALIAGLVALALVSSCSPDTSSSSAKKGLHFTERDFKTVVDNGKLFYEGTTNKIGFVSVMPNLRKIPRRISTEWLCNSIDVEYDDPEVHRKGMAYLNDSQYYDHCEVVHVGSGYVIVRSSKPDCRRARAYISTSADYVDGERLKTGYYVLEGRKRVELTNGSSASMYAYVEMDAESSRLAIEALAHNAKAKAAVEEENNMRQTRIRDERERQFLSQSVTQLKSKIGKLSFDVADRIYLPVSLCATARVVVDDVIRNCSGLLTFSELKGARELKDFEQVAIKIGMATRTYSDYGFTDDDVIKNVQTGMRKLMAASAYIIINHGGNLDDLKSKYRVILLDKNSEQGYVRDADTVCVKSDYWPDGFSMPLKDEMYFVDKNNKQLMSLIGEDEVCDFNRFRLLFRQMNGVILK